MTTKDQEQPQLSVYEDELKQMEAVTAAVKQRRAPSKFVHRHRAQSIIQSEALDQLETEVVTTGLYENVNVKFGSAAGIVAAEVFYSESLAVRVSLEVGMLYGWIIDSRYLTDTTIYGWMHEWVAWVGSDHNIYAYGWLAANYTRIQRDNQSCSCSILSTNKDLSNSSTRITGKA